MEIMGVTIRTIVSDNVAIRCDGCREVIDGTPWRVNLLDIVAPEVAVGWAESAPINPGPHQFHADAACVRRWMAEKGYYFCRRGEVREIMRPIALPAGPARLGPVRRHPPRRPRVRPRLTGRGRAVRGRAREPVDERSPACLHSRARRFGRPRFTQILDDRPDPRPRDRYGGLVPDARSRPERPPAERLPLGQASRLLGVDPDTLRRWADEGRVPAFTTLGGHRRFERRALERLVANRRTGGVGALGGVGDSTDRLNAAYRRRYGESHGDGPDLRAIVPEAHREAFRDTGRRLADALVRYLDGSGQARVDAEAEAIGLAALLGERVRDHGIPLEAGVTMFVAARRPFLAELRLVARRSGVNATAVGQLYDVSTGLLDRLLLVFVDAHAAAGADDLAPPTGASA